MGGFGGVFFNSKPPMDPQNVYMSWITSYKSVDQKKNCQILNKFQMSPFWLFRDKSAKYRQYSNLYTFRFLKHIISNLYNLLGVHGGTLKFHKAPTMPPKKVRKFCCFDTLNGELQRQTPMDLKSGITSKTKLPQQKWPYIQKI